MRQNAHCHFCSASNQDCDASIARTAFVIEEGEKESNNERLGDISAAFFSLDPSSALSLAADHLSGQLAIVTSEERAQKGVGKEGTLLGFTTAKLNWRNSENLDRPDATQDAGRRCRFCLNWGWVADG